ncbi:acylphosphatase [Enterococcus camelliae]|uniref:acylphosphatase n=1 Tax=Enterococcus camelliae TaxID=453959 RepID=A0ABW5TJB4_9ENTE
MRKIRMHVAGRVQGVGFRYMTKMLADQLNIGGSVKNERDGSVTILATGDDQAIAVFIQKVRHSPSPAGRVTNFELTEDESLPDYSSFQVVYS